MPKIIRGEEGNSGGGTAVFYRIPQSRSDSDSMLKTVFCTTNSAFGFVLSPPEKYVNAQSVLMYVCVYTIPVWHSSVLVTRPKPYVFIKHRVTLHAHCPAGLTVDTAVHVKPTRRPHTHNIVRTGLSWR